MGRVIKENISTPENRMSLIESVIKEKNFKFTGQRKRILEILCSENKLFDTEEIFLILKKDDSRVGIATVYRTLDLLTRLKIVCKLIVGTDKSMYTLSSDCLNDNYVYMICDNCKRIIMNNKCLKNAIKIRLRDDAEENILKNCNLKIDNFQIVFTGLCNDCHDGH